MHIRSLLITASLIAVASCSDKPTRDEIATSGTLTLVREKNLGDLLPSDTEYEASGVALHAGSLRIVFDNRTHVANVDLALSSAALGPGKKSPSQHEGITVATKPVTTSYVVTEGGVGTPSAIVTVDDDGRAVATEPTDIVIGAGDKGLEGIAWLDDIERLLVLCEANSCGTGDVSRGHGVLKSLRHDGRTWVTETTLSIPSIAAFADYSDLAVFPEGDGRYRIAVLSQENAAVWLGELTSTPLAIASEGAVYDFPKAKGKTQYCSLEGAAFLDATTIAFVSDRAKKDDACTKAEAVHVFALP